MGRVASHPGAPAAPRLLLDPSAPPGLDFLGTCPFLWPTERTDPRTQPRARSPSPPAGHVVSTAPPGMWWSRRAEPGTARKSRGPALGSGHTPPIPGQPSTVLGPPAPGSPRALCLPLGFDLGEPSAQPRALSRKPGAKSTAHRSVCTAPAPTRRGAGRPVRAARAEATSRPRTPSPPARGTGAPQATRHLWSERPGDMGGSRLQMFLRDNGPGWRGSAVDLGI